MFTKPLAQVAARPSKIHIPQDPKIRCWATLLGTAALAVGGEIPGRRRRPRPDRPGLGGS